MSDASLPDVSVDETFTTVPDGWPNTSGGPARHVEGVYELESQHANRFVAVTAPIPTALRDVVVSARFHKSGGPPGGGYGLMVRDQGPDVHDGTQQGGRFVVLEVGDQGTVGVWQHEENWWKDLLPWTPSTAVRPASAANDLTVRARGTELTFLVNDVQVAHVYAWFDHGRVGVFVGGDGNQAVLERFAVRSPDPGGSGPAWSVAARPQDGNESLQTN